MLFACSIHLLGRLLSSVILCDSTSLTVPMDDNDAADACTRFMPVFTYTYIIHFALRSALSSIIETGSLLPPLVHRSIYAPQDQNTAIIHNVIRPPYHNVSSVFFLSFFTTLFTLCTPGTLKYKLGDWPGATWWLRYPRCAGSR